MGKMAADYNTNIEKINKDLISKRNDLRVIEKLLLNANYPSQKDIQKRLNLISEIKNLEVEHSYIKRELEFL